MKYNHAYCAVSTILYVIYQQYTFICVLFIGMCVSVLPVASSSSCSVILFMCLTVVVAASYCAITRYFFHMLLCNFFIVFHSCNITVFTDSFRIAVVCMTQ